MPMKEGRTDRKRKKRQGEVENDDESAPDAADE